MQASEVPERTIVIIESPDFFVGRKVASTLGKCKWHENAVECLLFEEEVSVRKVCVGLDKPNDKLMFLEDFTA